MLTQLQAARAGTITGEVRFVAEAENFDAEIVRENAAAGRLVIPANKLHLKNNLANRHRPSAQHKGKCKYRHKQCPLLGGR